MTWVVQCSLDNHLHDARCCSRYSLPSLVTERLQATSLKTDVLYVHHTRHISHISAPYTYSQTSYSYSAFHSSTLVIDQLTAQVVTISGATANSNLAIGPGLPHPCTLPGCYKQLQKGFTPGRGDRPCSTSSLVSLVKPGSYLTLHDGEPSWKLGLHLLHLPQVLCSERADLNQEHWPS